MARNYSISEAVEIIAKGEDAESIQDLGRRYPLLVAKVAKATAGASGDAVVDLMSFMPEYLSANKVNKAIKTLVFGDDEPAAKDEEAEEKPTKKAPAKKAPAKKAPAAKGDPYKGMSAVDLFKECKKKGIKAEAKKTAKYYIDLLKKADAEDDGDDDDDWDDDDDEDEAPAKKAPAKKRGRPAKKADPEVDDDDDDDDDDDWDI